MNRNRVVLVALLGILAACLIYAYLATPRLEKAPPRPAALRTQPVDQKPPAEDTAVPDGRIDFAYLSSEPEEFSGAQRDIFRFGKRLPVKSTSAPPARVVARDDVPPVVRPEPVPVEVVQRSLSQFTFLGFLEKSGAKTVFLSSGGEMYLVKQGEHFGSNKEFRVEQIDDRLLKVSHTARDGLIEVELIEKKKLNARPIVRQSRQVSMDDGLMGNGNDWPETKREGMQELLPPDTLRQPVLRPGSSALPVRPLPQRPNGS